MRTIQRLQEENEAALERLSLSMERLQVMLTEDTVSEKYRDFFKKNAAFLLKLYHIALAVKSGEQAKLTLEQLKQQNTELYEDILDNNYNQSYANPAYAVSVFGEEYGKIITFLATEVRSLIPCAFEYKLLPFTMSVELFIEVYNYFEEEDEYTYKDVKRAIYYFASDYAEDFMDMRVREMYDPTYTFAYDIIMDSDLSDLRYLYKYGEYITDNELKIAEFLNELSPEEVKAMADTYTEGYVRGFVMMGADLSKKSIVGIRTCIGFERMMRYAFQNFENLGKKVTVYRVATDVINRKGGRKVGYYATSPNPQYEYDHRFDKGLFFDKNYAERHLVATKAAMEKYRVECASYAGPAVLETFGEPDFEPVNKPEVIHLDKKQQELNTQSQGQISQMMQEFIKSEEISFTIIAYPLPSIGDKFQDIFAETVKVNNLDNEEYKAIQQHIIDALDQGVYCQILGANGNTTDLKVMLYELKNPEKETIFENCTADVNIPVGEVFTSPKLTGTNGCLNVSKVFLNGLEYKDLKICFEDGMISDYSCSNFTDSDQNANYVKENILMNRDTLPLGEFAIGTNTTAYVMGRKFDIQRKLPILIAEKTGPHFAVGDTCYSRSEDHKVYNPNGKEIVARENEVSALRHTDMAKAYVNCHTDITIPYDEIKEISVHTKDNQKIMIIEDGRFVLPGTEQLNDALKELQ